MSRNVAKPTDVYTLGLLLMWGLSITGWPFWALFGLAVLAFISEAMTAILNYMRAQALKVPHD